MLSYSYVIRIFVFRVVFLFPWLYLRVQLLVAPVTWRFAGHGFVRSFGLAVVPGGGRFLPSLVVF